MTEIEIDVKAKIFDDPDYCNSDYRIGERTRCWYLIGSWCNLFPSKENGNQLIKQNAGHHIKCDQCKEAWKTKKDEILT
jgi:hypothetical protein